MRSLSWINFVLGLWLIVAAFVLSAGTGPIMAEEIALGVIIAVFAYLSAVRPSSVVSWIVVLAGLWTLLGPSIIGYGAMHASRANDVVVGIVVLVLGFANAVFRESPVRTRPTI